MPRTTSPTRGAPARVEQRAGHGLPCDWVSLAINSAAARSQNQLHIHVDCVRADVRKALATHGEDLQDHDTCPPPAEVIGKQGSGLREAPVEEADRLTVQIAVAVHLDDDEPAVTSLGSRDEGVAREVRVARLAGDRAGIA